jgi:G3E family GTPase
MIETTGLADPVPILATLLSDPVAASAYRLDGIVTVVDAVNGETDLDTHEEAVRQAAVADRIIISKADLADPAGLRCRLRRLNPGAAVVESTHGRVDPTFVLNAGVLDPSAKSPEVRGWLDAAAFEAGHDHHHHDPNRHDARIAAFCVTLDQPIDWPALAMWLEMMVASKGAHLLRIKGILNVKGQDRPVAIHAVQHLMHPTVKLRAWPEGDPRTSRLVFITRDLPHAVIEDGLRAFQNVA